MKYTVFVWVAVVFVILYMDCYCRKHVKLQRHFFLLKINPSVLNIHLLCENTIPSLFSPSVFSHGNIFKCLQYVLFS